MGSDIDSGIYSEQEFIISNENMSYFENGRQLLASIISQYVKKYLKSNLTLFNREKEERARGGNQSAEMYPYYLNDVLDRTEEYRRDLNNYIDNLLNYRDIYNRTRHRTGFEYDRYQCTLFYVNLPGYTENNDIFSFSISKKKEIEITDSYMRRRAPLPIPLNYNTVGGKRRTNKNKNRKCK